MRIPGMRTSPRMTVDALGALGNDVKDIRGTLAQGLPDPELWRVATTEARLLITTDKGFSEFRTVPHHGILIVRLRQPNRHKIHHAVMRAMQVAGGLPLGMVIWLWYGNDQGDVYSRPGHHFAAARSRHPSDDAEERSGPRRDRRILRQ